MSFFERLRRWVDENRDLAFELVRIYLGVGLFAKGVYFAGHVEDTLTLMEQGALNTSNIALAHYIALAHLGGGLLMAVGFLTRIAALIQIPILAGAVFVVHLREGLFTGSQNLEFAILVLFLLTLAFFHGGGRLSADYRMSRPKGELGGDG